MRSVICGEKKCGINTWASRYETLNADTQNKESRLSALLPAGIVEDKAGFGGTS